MASEELTQRGYMTPKGLKGDTFGSFELLNLGATSIAALATAGLDFMAPAAHAFTPTLFKPTKTPSSLKPDAVYARRDGKSLVPVALGEHKKSGEFSGTGAEKRLLSAQEQALLNALALGVDVAFVTDGTLTEYVDVLSSVDAGAIVPLVDNRAFTAGVLEDLLNRTGALTDPTPLAERVWQLIWHATKAEPKECLLTFVEIFMLKFLSDNLPPAQLPANLNFYALVGDPKKFKDNYGTTEVEYYVNSIRPRIKTIFPDNTISDDPEVAKLFGLSTVVSKTSIINGFVFLQSSGKETHESYNLTFRAVIEAFNDFGPLTRIDPEFKLRLYETFLRKSARLQRLGQFFTPRNVVRQMVAMAQLNKLADGEVVLDPAAGVGGFLLEPLMWADALESNLTIKNGKPLRRIRTVGVDVDADLHILSKANMLIHLAELVRDPSTTMAALNKAMAESFVLMDDNKTLGSLMHPPIDSVSTILTNPPYVTRGSGVYKDALRAVNGAQNGTILKDYYDRAGLGVEALFLRYVTGALKPGGRAFVIVPQGLLNRTERGPKQQLLDDCNILASIQLPRNTFFNTAQKTYILVLERRHTAADTRPDVFCGIARSIGESLDWRRNPTPDDNDLADIAAAFIQRDNGDDTLALASAVVKLVPAHDFGVDDRWDVPRFWSDDELVELGESVAPMARSEFIEESRATMETLTTELEAARAELDELTSGDTVTVPISDETRFVVRSGTRITTQEITDHPPVDAADEVIVYSCFKNPYITKGSVSRKWLATNTKRDRRKSVTPKYPLEPTPLVTVNANGASVGKVFVRPADCLLTDDVIGVLPLKPAEFDLDYLSIALQSAVNAGGFLYEAKLFATRVKELEILVPVDDKGVIDVSQQQKIASAIKRFEAIVERIADVGRWSADARFV